MPVRRRIEFDDRVWHALHHYLCLETGQGLQDIARRGAGSLPSCFAIRRVNSCSHPRIDLRSMSR
jgi:hypothetical protein